MINFKPLKIAQFQEYGNILRTFGCRGCEYNFVNLYAWGRQQTAIVEGNLAFFSQFSGQSIYPFPIGFSDPRPTLDALMRDAKERGIAFRITSLSEADMAYLEAQYPGKFHYHTVRSNFDYVYAIDDLADLKGKKYQKKRNHCNRFHQLYPNATTVPLTEETLPILRSLFDQWYERRMETAPHEDLYMERIAVERTLRHLKELELEGLILLCDGQPIAAAVASRLCKDTFDIHFEKALEEYDGAYPVINQEFAKHLRDKYPDTAWLNREDDLGLEGLRKAKLSYYPARLIEKHWAALWEEEYEY